MYLRNPFPKHVRLLYLYEYSCHNCGRSGKGLELNHIVGRHSDSAFNASLLCIPCHAKVGHARDEESRFFEMNMRFLIRIGYHPTDKDYAFLEKFPYLMGLSAP